MPLEILRYTPEVWQLAPEKLPLYPKAEDHLPNPIMAFRGELAVKLPGICHMWKEIHIPNLHAFYVNIGAVPNMVLTLLANSTHFGLRMHVNGGTWEEWRTAEKVADSTIQLHRCVCCMFMISHPTSWWNMIKSGTSIHDYIHIWTNQVWFLDFCARFDDALVPGSVGIVWRFAAQSGRWWQESNHRKYLWVQFEVLEHLHNFITPYCLTRSSGWGVFFVSGRKNVGWEW